MEKTLMLEKTKGRMKGGPQRMRWLYGIIDSIDMSLSKVWKIRTGYAAVSPQGFKVLGMIERLNNNNKPLS